MDSQSQLTQAIEHLKTGRRAQAQSILARLVQEQPGNADAWVMLSACFDQPERKSFCLDKALSIDPNHPKAMRALEELSGAAGAGMEAAMETPEEIPAFTPDSMAELSAMEEAGETVEPVADSWESAAEQPERSIHQMDPWEIPHAQQAAEAEGPLDPCDIPQAEEEQAGALETAWSGEPTESRASEGWDVPDEWNQAAGEEGGDAEVDVRGAKAKPKAEVPPARSYPWYQVWLMALTS